MKVEITQKQFHTTIDYVSIQWRRSNKKDDKAARIKIGYYYRCGYEMVAECSDNNAEAFMKREKKVEL